MSHSSNRTLEIIISPTGQTRITARGYSGTACKAATRDLEKALGFVQSDTPTSDMYQTNNACEDQRERG